jgi:hypothetical protein
VFTHEDDALRVGPVALWHANAVYPNHTDDFKYLVLLTAVIWCC